MEDNKNNHNNVPDPGDLVLVRKDFLNALIAQNITKATKGAFLRDLIKQNTVKTSGSPGATGGAINHNVSCNVSVLPKIAESQETSYKGSWKFG